MYNGKANRKQEIKLMLWGVVDLGSDYSTLLTDSDSLGH